MPRALLVFALAALAAASALAKPASPRPRAAKTITVDLQDADIKNVIRLFADVSGLNFVVGDDVEGTVTIKLKNVPWDQALDVVLSTHQLGVERRGTILRVAKQSQLDEERARARARVARCEDTAPLRTTLIPVNNAAAADLLPLVETTLSERGSVRVDVRTNTLIVRDVDCP